MMKRSMIASGALHAGVIVFATVAWPHAIDLSDEAPSVVPVELVQVWSLKHDRGSCYVLPPR